MAHTRICRLLIACSLVSALTVSRAAAQTPVPYTTFQIHGTQDGDDGVTATYRAYRNGTDPFRVVCSEPCTADQPAIFGLYAGFASVYSIIVGLFGVPATAAAQPFDMHIEADHWCGPEQPGLGGDSAMYSWYPFSGLTTGSYGCFWFTTPGHYSIPFQYPDTSTRPYHLLTAHEFTHTEFFNRHYYSYEDFAKAIGAYITDPNTQQPVTDPCDDSLNKLSDGKMIWALCQRNGFQYSSLAAAFIAMDNLYTHGKGTAGTDSPPATSVFQFRSALNKALGNNTLDAWFAGQQVGRPYLGSNGTLPYGGGLATALDGWVSYHVPVNALTADFPFHLDGRYHLNGGLPGLFRFDNAYQLSATGPNPPLHFDDPVYMRMKYDPSLLNVGTDETTLRLYTNDGQTETWHLVADSHVDPSKMIISGSITSPGIVVASASTTTITPTLVLPRAVTNSHVHTRVVLRNPSFYTVTGTLTFHPQGAAASPSDPVRSYSLEISKVLVIDDVVSYFGATSPGSVDITATTPSLNLPDVYAIDVETGPSTFAGAIVPVYTSASALATGDRALLVAPGNLQQQTFGFVVRTFGSGVSFTVTARDASGALIATTPLTYAANTMSQISPQTFAAGTQPTAGESYDISIQSGSALILGEESGHGAASHLFHLAERVDLSASATGDSLHIAKALSVTNADGTTLRTALQLTNVSTSTITGHVRLTPADGSAAAGFAYSIAPGVTKTFADVVGKVSLTGSVAIEIASSGGNLPMAFSRLIYSGSGTGWQVATEAAADLMDLLQAGDRAVVVAPNSASQTFNIGVRTFQKDLALTITVNDTSGFQLKKLVKTFPAGSIVEDTASNVLGMTLTAGQVVEMLVDGGGGLVYASAANSSGGGVNYQAASRLPYY